MKGKDRIYKIYVRIGIIKNSLSDYKLHLEGKNIEDTVNEKLLDEEYLLKNGLYFSDGYIVMLDDGTFKGYLTNDHIIGFIQNNSMTLVINVNQNAIYKKPLSGVYEFIDDFDDLDISSLNGETFILKGIDQKKISYFAWITFYEEGYNQEKVQIIKKLEEQYKKF